MKHQLSLTLNGDTAEGLVEARTSLLTFIRESAGLTGTKRGCEEGECGACAVQLDGRLVDSCLIFALEAQGKTVTTVEGLGDPHHLSPVQSAFAESGASQCGFCIPGMLLATTALLDRESNPDQAAIRKAISGNLCRCTGYTRIVEAIQLAAELKHTAQS